MLKLRVLTDNLLDGEVGHSAGMSELQADYLISCEATQGRCQIQVHMASSWEGEFEWEWRWPSGRGCSPVLRRAEARLLAWRPEWMERY